MSVDYSSYEGPAEDRAAFLRDNAVSIVDELQAQAARHRDVITRLHKHRESTVRERKRLLRALGDVWAVLDAVLDRRAEDADILAAMTVIDRAVPSAPWKGKR